MNKLSNKRSEILNTALPLVRRLGFESLSIANLAREVGMSKSGLFAHFNSKEKMHMMILDHAAVDFTQQVIIPSLGTKRGLPRLKKIISNWLLWYGGEQEGTCPFVAAGVEYDFKPGPVKDRLQFHLNSLINSISKAVDLCIEEGQFSSRSDSNQIAFEIYSYMIGSQIYYKTLESKDSRKILKKSLNNLYLRYSEQEKL